MIDRLVHVFTGIAIAYPDAVEMTLINSQEQLARELSLSRILRCIGQKLEGLDLKLFEIKRHGGVYLIQGIQKGTSSSVDVELRYTAQEILELENEGKNRRGPASGKSHLLNLSQVLRLAGAYVDHLEGRFLKVSWQIQSDKIQSITIQYEPREDERGKEDRSTTTIEEICVHVYKQRKKLPGSFSKYGHGASESAR